MTNSVTVSAAANVALIKYWGKLPGDQNQPATPSLSIGLENLRTITTLTKIDDDKDQFKTSADQALAGDAQSRVRAYLDKVRAQFKSSQHFSIETSNNFPTGSGLASSASGFAALALAINEIGGFNLGDDDITRLARQGSGSAARSIFGGYVEIVADQDAYAQRIIEAETWPLSVIVAVTSEAPKSINSTVAMQQTAATSPMYPAWVESHAADMQLARDAIAAQDFNKLAEVSEHNCLKMHAAMLTTQPGIVYWRPGTIEVMHRVRSLRLNGTAAFFTIDAGPQVKVVCQPEDADTVNAALIDAPGVVRTIQTRVGGEPAISRS